MSRETRRQLLPINPGERLRLMTGAWAHLDLLKQGQYSADYVVTLLSQCNVASALGYRLAALESQRLDAVQSMLSNLLLQARCPDADEQRLIGQVLTMIDALFGRVARRDLVAALQYVHQRIQQKQVERIEHP